jgi:F-type H+-transporting ATPase subunit a
MKTTLKFIVTLSAFLATSASLFAGAKSAEQGDKKEFDAVEVIMHHIADAHEFHILDYVDSAGVEHPVSLPLPVILFTDGHLDVFMSSAFDHGHADVVRGNRTYRMDHGHITELGGLHPIDFSITKNVFSMFLSLIIILSIFISVGRTYRKGNVVPKGLASFMEPLVLFVRDDIAVPNIGKKADKFLPYLLTVFFFIWINNLIGLVPFFPGSANLTGNISFTVTLALITFLITNFNGNKDYWKHIFATPGVPVWLAPIMIPVEIMGILAKPIALLIRLFANITAGHIIILSLISLIFIFKSVAIAPVSVGFVLFMNVLELLVAAIQAYIFTLLSALFIGMAVEEHEHH